MISRYVLLWLLPAAFGAAGPVFPAEMDDATAAFQRGDYATASKTFRKLADHGDAQAQKTLGVMYLQGWGVPQDNTEALKWFRQAAEQGDPEAQSIVGLMYLDGRGSAKDNAEALKWFRKAADKGDVQVQRNLGVFYRRGWGVPHDDAEALKWFRRAADQGAPQAQGNLGDMYYRGQGVPQDYSEALKWFRKAADRGATQALVNLGVMYQNGHGVHQDYAQALKWFEAGGAAPACANCLAWLLATCPDASIRNGQKALSLATGVVQQNPSAANLDTLAAAYAETGNFGDAVLVQKQALAQLKSERFENQEEAHQTEARFRDHLEAYQGSQPWRKP